MKISKFSSERFEDIFEIFEVLAYYLEREVITY